MKVLGYSWAIRQLLKVAPGATHTFHEQTDDGHAMDFDMNSTVLNKVCQYDELPVPQQNSPSVSYDPH